VIQRAGGWQIRKRPGVDRFLERAHRAGYEIVLWANMPQYEVEALIAELDPSGFIKHKLYTEHTNFKKIGDAAPALVKDLVRLQRDPKRLIVVDVDTRKYAPIDDKQNVMTIQPFVDDVHDHELKNLTALLESQSKQRRAWARHATAVVPPFCFSFSFSSSRAKL
jgi:TFIIF-interacting CTD phosphatase-like protein